MTGIHKTINKALPKEVRTPADKKIAEENISTHESLDRRMNPQVATEDETVIPLADEEELARVRRRQRRSGGRSSTVLTDDEKLGG